ncbi:alginate export family protein [Alkalimarinus alittae]|uniref:Alginate export family protein n=1 Tax=Alkalimarinus alittae TaxID=2961619 RepID=A0ABY6N2N9_9ALTE|nr:alginate export family protein [Alkalimarinus alittae]UZE96310.1 alginate export family protein [Alkalimarinus alittae]
MNQRMNASPVKALSLALAGVLTMEGCSTLPDMRLAKQSKINGDYALAIENYKALADSGYFDAAIYLGDTYLQQDHANAERLAEASYRKTAVDGTNAKTRGYAEVRLAKLLARKQNATVAELKESDEIFRKLYQQGNDEVLPLMVKLHMAHPQLWPDEDTLGIINEAKLRGLPDANLALLLLYKRQGYEQANLSEMALLCEEVLSQVVGCYPELAEIYQVSNDSESISILFNKAKQQYQLKLLEPSILYRMANVLVKTKQSEIRPTLADDTYQLVQDEYPRALLARIRLRLDNPYFSNSEEVLHLLAQAKQLHLPEANMLTGKLYYDGKLVPLDPVLAEKNLLKASGQFAAADYWLGQIYLRGYLGKSDIQKGQRHLLLAARAGSKSADYALAEMYNGGAGVAPNPTYSYLFSGLAAEAGSTKASLLHENIKQTLSLKQQSEAEGLLAQEKQFRAGDHQDAIALSTPTVSSVATTDFEASPIDYPSYEWGVSTQFSYRWDDDRYLGLKPNGDTNEFQINLKPWIKAELNEDWRFFTELQAFAATDVTEIDSDQGGGSSDGFLGAREFWFDYKGITSYPGETLRLGLQRIREDDGIWWDKNIESIRWIFDTTTFFAFAGVAQQFYQYRTDENELSDSDKDQLNLFTTLSWQWQPGHHIGSRVLYKNVDADPEAVGQTASQDDLNNLARGDFYWFGLNTKSDYFNYRSEENIHYYAELTWLHFDGDNATLSPGSQPSTIAGYQSETADNVAIDLGLRWKLPVAPRVHLGAAMAMGSGGNGSDKPNSFVQTGLQSNRSRFTGTRASFHRFNEAYRAELTNLQVATLYGTLADPSQFDLSVVYQYFQRDNADQGVVASGVSAPLVNGSKDLGHGVDIVTSYYFRQILPLVNWRFERDAYARLRASTFKPGDAYGNDADSLKYRITMDVSFQF